MSYQINSTVTVNDSRKAICTQLNPGDNPSMLQQEGDIYYDSTLKVLKVHDGSGFKIV